MDLRYAIAIVASAVSVVVWFVDGPQPAGHDAPAQVAAAHAAASAGYDVPPMIR
jgi:hypothetical protein